MLDNKKYTTVMKHEIPTKEEVRKMVDTLEMWLPMTREQIVHRAVEKYYLQHKAKKELVRWDARSFLMGEQHHECYYCHKYLSNKNSTIDHKLPLARGGTSAIENLCLACYPCNQEKNTMNEEEYVQFIHSKELDRRAFPDLQLP